LFEESRGNHSAKPLCVYEWIERAFPQKTKLEMYCRKPRNGWAAWGNEV
jgi:N6-adenosine-specific RNA methylase IME4